MHADEQHSWPWWESLLPNPIPVLQDYCYRSLIHSQGTISSSVMGDNTGKTLFTAREATLQNGSGLALAKTCPEQLSTGQRETITLLCSIYLHGLQREGDLDSYIQFKAQLQLHHPSQTRQFSPFMGVS